MTSPPFRYHAVGGDVFLIRDAAPDLWQRVAIFVSAERASDYAEVENMMISDFQDEKPRYETLAPPVVEPLPQSSVTVSRVSERITVRSSGHHADDAVSADITRRLADGESVRTVMAANNTVQIRRDALVETKALEPRRQGKPTLSPEEIEGRVQVAWKAIQELDAEGGKLGYATVAERAGVPHGSIAPAIKALVDRGLIQVFGHGQMDATELRERGGIRVVRAEKVLPAYMPPAPEWLDVDLDRNTARAAGMKDIVLTSTEAELLFALAEKRGTVLSIERLITKVYGLEEPADAEGLIPVFISKVRKKLEGSPFEIVNHRGRGFELIRRAEVVAAAVHETPVVEEPAEPEPEDEAPPMGCILNAAEIPDFKRCWGAGDSMREMAEQFNLTTIEVADVRKKLGLPNRVAERLST